MWMLLHIYHIRENRREREGEGRWGSSIAGRTKAAEIGVHQATATRPPPHRQTSFPPKTSPNFSFRFIKAVGQYSVLMGLSVGNLIARWDEMDFHSIQFWGCLEQTDLMLFFFQAR